MSRRVSYSKLENELVKSFRDKTNTAVTVEDITRAFAETMDRLLAGVFGELPFAPGAVSFDAGAEKFHRLREDLQKSKAFRQIFDESDLPQIIVRFAETAARRRGRILERREKTEAKIRN